MRWQDVEIEVRKIAEAVWMTNARPEVVAGVKCDTVLKVRDNYWILIEVTKLDG